MIKGQKRHTGRERRKSFTFTIIRNDWALILSVREAMMERRFFKDAQPVAFPYLSIWHRSKLLLFFYVQSGTYCSSSTTTRMMFSNLNKLRVGMPRRNVPSRAQFDHNAISETSTGHTLTAHTHAQDVMAARWYTSSKHRDNRQFVVIPSKYCARLLHQVVCLTSTYLITKQCVGSRWASIRIERDRVALLQTNKCASWITSRRFDFTIDDR